MIACFILILGALVFGTFLETGLLRDLIYAVLGAGGALLFIIGVERWSRPSFRWVQLVGWLMMAGFSLIPTSLFLPVVVVLAALPALFVRFQSSSYASGRPPAVHQQSR
jgi:hypothetical protein